MLLCFSTSDKNAVPVEYAAAVTASGVPTVAVCSSAYFGQEPHNSCGRHLHEVCTMYIDNMAPFGDACLHLENTSADITPLSTVTGVYILNSILAEAAQLALKRGAPCLYIAVFRTADAADVLRGVALNRLMIVLLQILGKEVIQLLKRNHIRIVVQIRMNCARNG